MYYNRRRPKCRIDLSTSIACLLGELILILYKPNKKNSSSNDICLHIKCANIQSLLIYVKELYFIVNIGISALTYFTTTNIFLVIATPPKWINQYCWNYTQW